jgi:tRNA dimethylallyltransferase
VSAAEDALASRAIAIAERAEKSGETVAIVGPTASGKTAIAVAIAEALGGEIVSADSVQVYRFFDVGSGKPSAEERERARHHLVDAIDPLDAIDAVRFAELAHVAIADIRARGKVPVVCGGTFLWQKALFFGLADAPPANPDIRARHKNIADTEGREALHRMLAAIDEEAAARLHPNDVVRVSRALEVHELSGETQSARHARHRFGATRIAPRFVTIDVPADLLTERIRARVASFLERGFVDEVRDLTARGFGEARAMGAVGYKEVAAHLRSDIAAADLAEAIVRATRVYARRQRTWLNHVDVARLRAGSS